MQLLNLLASTSCLFLLLFSFHLFFARKGNKLLNVLLSLLFFSRFGQILIIFLATSAQLNATRITFLVFTPFYYAAPACFYLYLSCFIDNKNKLESVQWLHFIPACLALIHVLPWPATVAINWDTVTSQLAADGYFSLKERSGLFPAAFQYTFRPILVIIYLTLAWIKLLLKKQNNLSKITDTERYWLFFFVRIATFFQILGLVPAIFKAFQIPYSLSFFIIINCLALLCLILFILHKPSIFYGHLLVAVDWNKKALAKEALTDQLEENDKQPNIKNEDPGKPTPKPGKKAKIPEPLLEIYCQSMKELMTRQELYLLPDFQIIDLAAKLDIPVHHCSYIINNHIGKNFRDWLNGYRIAHFLKQHPIKGDKITIEAIAYESGFKSLATFYNAFKKEKGSMPSYYLNQETQGVKHE